MSERPLTRYLLFAAALFFTSFFVGVVMVRLDPSIGTSMIAAFRDQVVRQIINDQTGVIGLKIFINNLVACLVLFLGGATAGLLSLIVLGANGVLIGAVLEVVRTQRGSLYVAAAILPHGIFEIPAFLISAALGFMLAGALSADWHGDEDAGDTARRLGRIFLTVVVPLVFVAAFIESFITPQIIHLVS
jgi:stage II sporulation protein M